MEWLVTKAPEKWQMENEEGDRDQETPAWSRNSCPRIVAHDR